MRPLALSQLAQWLQLPPPASDPSVRRIVTDSRSVQPGDLFVALTGERVDGHDFVAAAAAAGAVAALVSRPLELPLPQLQVPSPLLALGSIAAALRKQRRTRVLALTGSNGKTTVKTLLLAILQQVGRAYANPGNRNNELGMPLALIEQPEDADYAIYEMGAGQPGDIDYLARIARPQVALVNNIAPAHLERMGTLLGIAQTKGAIYHALPADGVAVLNADDAFAPWFADRLAGSGRRLLRFGLEASAEVTAEAIEFGTADSRFRLLTPAGQIELRLPLAGRHNLRNALAAAAMAQAVELPLTAIAAGLAAAEAVPGRQQRIALAAGGWLIDDSYNANPGSLAAAIASLAALPGERWLVLGDMRELGADAVALHAEAGRQAAAAGIQRLWTVGDLAAAAAVAFGPRGHAFGDQASLISALCDALEGDVCLLVKGSRGSRMDRVVAALRAAKETPHAA